MGCFSCFFISLLQAVRVQFVLDLAKDAQVGLVDYEYKKVDYVRSYQPEPDIKKDRINDRRRFNQ